MGRGKWKEGERRQKGIKGVEGGERKGEGRKREEKGRGRGKGKGEMVPHFLVQSDANVSQRYT